MTSPRRPRRSRATRAASVLLLLLVASFAVTPGAAMAQRPAEVVVRHVDRFTTEDGLAENNVRAVVQDRAGFIWILSRGGVLQRYDGHTFVDFRLLDSTLFVDRSPDVDALIIDDDGFPWISVASFLVQIDSLHRAGMRIALEHSVTAATTDGRGTLWIVDAGRLKSIDTRAPSPAVKPFGASAAQSRAVIGAGASGVIWIATASPDLTTVERLDLASGQADTITSRGIGAPFGIRQDDAGRVWLSGGRGLFVLEPGASQFRVVPGFQGRATTAAVPDENGALLVASDDALARLGPDGRVSEWLKSNEVFGRSAIPTATFVDREAGIWLATTTAGLVRLHTTRPAFDNYSSRSKPPLPLASDFVMALHEQRDGTLWIGTLRGGAWRMSPDWKRAARLPTTHDRSVSGNDAWDFEEDQDGNLWVGTGGGICRVSQPVVRCVPVADGAVDIERDSSGWFWLAQFDRGLISFDPRREQFGERVAAVGSGQPVSSLYAERDSGWMWVGSGLEILRVRVNGGTAGTVERFASPLGTGDLTYQFYRDRRGTLFAATGAGLVRFRPGLDRFEFVEPRELRSSTIFSMAEDPAGRLWLGSAHGLVYYAPDRGYVRLYNRRDNFLSGELNRRASLVRQNGTLVFGGIEGMTEFDPDVLTGTRDDVPVLFTTWSRLTPDGRVDESLVGSSTIRLRPTDRAFTIQFAALSYSPDLGRRYRYRIEGLNPAWVESSEHMATYSAPSPGNYLLQVQASTGGGGDWSGPVTSMQLVVLPPFWMTTWFRIALISLAAVLFWTLHRWRLRQALVTERLRLRISRDLHDEIGAGLSSIALLSDTTGASVPEPAQLKRIGESARTMVADLRDIVWAIDPEADRGHDVESRMRDVAASLLRDIKVTFDMRTNGTGQIDMEVRRDLLRLYKEILHNVAKHAQATEAHISLQLDNRAMKLTVTDNGIGFSPDRQHNGTGLKSLRERAARLGGELQLDSTPGSGTTVRFVHRGTRSRRAAAGGAP